MHPHLIEIIATILFFIAIVHTFSTSWFIRLAHRYPADHALSICFHLLGEIEIVFGMWAFVLILLWSLMFSPTQAMSYYGSLHFVEPVFVFCIMVTASTKPIMFFVKQTLLFLSQALQKAMSLKQENAMLFIQLWVLLVAGPLAGSYITEPAAMTVTALALNMMITGNNKKLLYFALGLLFVNVSIGGAMTSFAAPPILMVAGYWVWSTPLVFSLIGWKSLLAVVINTSVFLTLFKKEIPSSFHLLRSSQTEESSIPTWVVVLHLCILLMLILLAHEPSALIAMFCLFLGVSTVTQRYQSALLFRQSFLVAFFLAGIIVFGALQKWWLEPILVELDKYLLYAGATILTAFTDNAALTYLGAQVPNLPAESRYYLVTGALTGGGLTLIANAPNAAGFSILQKRFPNGLEAFELFKGALLPTLITISVYMIFS